VAARVGSCGVLVRRWASASGARTLRAGAVFGGTDRRWYSAEPCHAFLAVAQGKIANPLVMIDELEKAGTRSDYGRLWDCLLAFLEPETNARYPDPALQTTPDLSQVSYVATANSLDPLPGPIRDRFRVVTFPKPAASDLEALLPAVIADLAKERGLDQAWVQSLSGTERLAVTRYWRGGSVRRLRRSSKQFCASATCAQRGIDRIRWSPSTNVLAPGRQRPPA
jgi:ATP-dependent Lon protease